MVRPPLTFVIKNMTKKEIVWKTLKIEIRGPDKLQNYQLNYSFNFANSSYFLSINSSRILEIRKSIIIG